MVLEAILDAVTRSIAPIVSHLVEEVYLHTPGHDGTALCVKVHLCISRGGDPVQEWLD